MLSKKERFRHILSYFEKHQPVAETELQYRTPYELIVAVILSAQCTDKRVNLIIPAFFDRFPDAGSLSSASTDEVFDLIKSCSYPNNKTRNLIGMAKTLMERFKGVVPASVAELQQLPGVGRKTANVVASVVFNLPALAVDTHVFRVAARLGLTTNARNPLQTEKQLIRHIPEHLIPIAHHWLILHGRYICMARNPKCHECPLTLWCRYYEKNRATSSVEIQTNRKPIA